MDVMKNKEILNCILKNLEISKTDIVMCYIYGSRLFQTNKKDADYDIFLILKGFYGPLKSNSSPISGIYEKLIFLEDFQLDIFIYELSFWNFKLEQNVVENISCFTIPKEYIIYDSGIKLPFELNYMKLKHSIDSYLGIHLQKGNRTLKPGTFHVAKKVFIHCIRTVKFAIQIIEKGLIYDYTCANQEFYEIQDLKDDKEEIIIWFYDKMYPLDIQLRNYLNKYKTISPYKNIDRESKFITKNTKIIKIEEEKNEEWNSIYLIDFIKKGRSLKDLEIYLNLSFDSIEKNLVKVSINETTRQSILADQCCGIIYNSDNLEIICYPFDRFQNHHCSQLFELDWKSVEITEKLNGINIYMYYYNSRWNLNIFKGNSSLTNHFLKSHSLNEIFEKFWKTWNDLKYELPKEKDQTFMFLFQPRLSNSKIILVGSREMKEFKEVDIFKYSQYELPKKLEIENISKEKDPFKIILSICNKLNPLEYEGYVAKDKNNQRITFKSELYKIIEEINCFERLSNIQEFFFKYNLKVVFIPGAIETFYFWYPDWKPYFNDIYLKSLDHFKKIKKIYNDLMIQYPEKRDFILESKKYPEYSYILFEMRSKNYSDPMEIFKEERNQSKLKELIFN